MEYLILSILCTTLISVVMRFSAGKSNNEMAFFAANYTVCTILSLGFRAGGGAAGNGVPFAVALGILSGILYLGSFMLMRKNILENGMMLTAVFMKLGVLVPTLLAAVLYHETMKPAGLAGFILAVAAIIVVNTAGREEGGAAEPKRKAGFGGRGLLLILLLVGGLTDFLAKVFEYHGVPEAKDIYLTGTFAMALLLCILLAAKRRQRCTAADLLFGAMVGVPNYFCSRFLLFALEKLPAVAVYPAYNIGGILLVTLAGVLLFQEKLTRRKAAGLLMILAALVLINL